MNQPYDAPPTPGTILTSHLSPINPASSIEELLRAYGAHETPRSPRFPPPPARARFPPKKPPLGRIHIRHRPGSSRQFSRPVSRRPPSSNGSRPRTRSESRPSTASQSRPTTRSDASSDVLGLTPLYELTGEMP